MIESVDTAKDEGTVFLSKIPGKSVSKGMGVVGASTDGSEDRRVVDIQEVLILINDVQGMINRRYFFRDSSFLNVYG